MAYFATNHPKTIPNKWQDYFVSYYELEQKHSLKDKLKIVSRFFYNLEAKRKIRRLINDFQPEVAHVHNIYHHLSPSILRELKKNKIPVVMTLHDYKLICPNYNLFVRGRIWERSKPRRYYRCFLDRCVKDSYFKSLICTLEAYFHYIFGFWRQVDIFISPSRFLADKFKEFDFRGDIRVVPNPLLDDLPSPEEVGDEDYFLYFGRLSPEKGVEDILEAWSLLVNRPRLLILGDGPQRSDLEELSKKRGLEEKVFFLGHQEKKSLFRYIKSARAVVFPSRWQENYPYSILEAGYLTKILVCVNIGGISELVKNRFSGLLYEPGDVEKLSQIVAEIKEKPLKFSYLGENISAQIKKENNPDKYYKDLINIYNLNLRKRI